MHDAVHGGSAWCESAVGAGAVDNGNGVARSRTSSIGLLPIFCMCLFLDFFNLLKPLKDLMHVCHYFYNFYAFVQLFLSIYTNS